MNRLFLFLLPVLSLITTPSIAAPETFRQAKILAKQEIYHDRMEAGTLYCGCHWEWTGESGGRIDHESCGYTPRTPGGEVRAARLEWEHVVPASVMGNQRQCWQEGGRRNCNATDPVFNAMEANLHNLSPSVGEINGDRSNYRFGALPSTPHQHGQCDFKVDFRQRVAEPRDDVKGKVARIYFYVHDRYDLPMSDAQQRLLMAWHHQFPPSDWELERNRRVTKVMGHGNEFITGERVWTRGHKNSRDGLYSPLTSLTMDDVDDEEIDEPVIGNKRSKIYHLPIGCPSYREVAEKNAVGFSSEEDAIAAGYRKAGNCR